VENARLDRPSPALVPRAPSPARGERWAVIFMPGSELSARQAAQPQRTAVSDFFAQLDSERASYNPVGSGLVLQLRSPTILPQQVLSRSFFLRRLSQAFSATVEPDGDVRVGSTHLVKSRAEPSVSQDITTHPLRAAFAWRYNQR
jgi:hypothetical protein